MEEQNLNSQAVLLHLSLQQSMLLFFKKKLLRLFKGKITAPTHFLHELNLKLYSLFFGN